MNRVPAGASDPLIPAGDLSDLTSGPARTAKQKADQTEQLNDAMQGAMTHLNTGGFLSNKLEPGQRQLKADLTAPLCNPPPASDKKPFQEGLTIEQLKNFKK